MHEFSLAEGIVEIIRESASKAGKKKVSKVVLEIGQLSGVEVSALDTALEVVFPEGGLIDVAIEKKITKGMARCLNCQHQFFLEDLYSLCPHCKAYQKEILSGREFNVLSIEIE